MDFCFRRRSSRFEHSFQSMYTVFFSPTYFPEQVHHIPENKTDTVGYLFLVFEVRSISAFSFIHCKNIHRFYGEITDNWFCKDNPTGHSERKKKTRQTEEEELGIQYQRVARNGLCQLNKGG